MVPVFFLNKKVQWCPLTVSFLGFLSCIIFYSLYLDLLTHFTDFFAHCLFLNSHLFFWAHFSSYFPPVLKVESVNNCSEVCMFKMYPRFWIFYDFFEVWGDFQELTTSWLLRKHLISFCLFKILKTILRLYFFLQLAHSGYTKLQKNTWNLDMNRSTLLEKWLKRLQLLWK